MNRKAIAALGAGVALLAGLGFGASPVAAGAAKGVVVYDSTESPLPGNVVSEPFEATSLSEFGDAVTLAGAQRTLQAVTVTLSSWGCENGTWNDHNCSTGKNATFTVPITLNVYAAPVQRDDGTVYPGRLLTTVTKSFAIPYRPTADLKHCNTANDSVGKWYDKKTATCYNGKAVNVVFNFASLRMRLPDSVVLGVAYNTTHHGYAPIGEDASCYGEDGGCGYDSLNVGVNGAGTPSVGTRNYEPGAWFSTLDTSYGACDSTPTIGEFNLNSPTTACNDPYVPAFQVTAK